MKKITSICLLATLIFSNSCIAAKTIDLTNPDNLELSNLYPDHDTLETINFNDTEGKFSRFLLKNNQNPDSNLSIKAHIGSGTSGEQRIYLLTNKACYNSEKVENKTIKTNDKNVIYNVYCHNGQQYFTPKSTAGLNYVINEFKRKKYVFFSVFIAYIDATGFTKAWNNYGGNAL